MAAIFGWLNRSEGHLRQSRPTLQGYALGTKPQLIRHLRISLGSAEELKCHLALAVDVGLIGESGRTFINDSDRLIGMLIGLLKSLGAKVPSRSRFPLPPSRFPASH